MTDRRGAIRKVLVDNGLEPGNTMHSWRCSYPDIYGPCDCLDVLVDEIEKVIATDK